MIRKWFHHRDIVSRQVDLYMIISLLLIKETMQFKETMIFLTLSTDFSIIPNIDIGFKLLSQRLGLAGSEFEYGIEKAPSPHY